MVHIGCMIAIGLYLYLDREGERTLSETSLWSFFAAVELVAAVSLVLIFRSMTPGYYKSFLSTETGKGYCCKRFREAKTEAEKIDVFDHHPQYYAFLRADVASWVRERWGVWKQNKPIFLNDKIVDCIPNDMISAQEKAEMKAL